MGNVHTTVEIARVGSRLNNGTAVAVDVTVTCSPWRLLLADGANTDTGDDTRPLKIR